jgi:hypothetical protein
MFDKKRGFQMYIELFDKAVDFIASRSDDQLRLSDWQDNGIGRTLVLSSSEVNCGTIACAAGWLALNPEFEELGVEVCGSGAPKFEDETAYRAMARLFGLPYAVALGLFYIRGFDDYANFGEKAMEHLTDRQLWLSRARLIRAEFVPKTNMFRMKSDEVESYTFYQILDKGTQTVETRVNELPWSFMFRGIAFTHELDSKYMFSHAGKTGYITTEDMLIIEAGGVRTMDREAFEKSYEPA